MESNHPPCHCDIFRLSGRYSGLNGTILFANGRMHKTQDLSSGGFAVAQKINVRAKNFMYITPVVQGKAS